MSTTRDKDRNDAMRLGYVDVHDRATFADGCAHRDRQTIAFLQSIADMPFDDRPTMTDMIEAIERGEHVK